jgi:hypothetical protein
MNYPT